MPKVSVVMSVYNGERYLCEAVDSIRNQTFTNFEFIIVDDGSTDSTWQILTEYAARDSRIVLIRNEKNIGLTKSLNKGLAAARGEYIARMDADDISLPERLHKQLHYMQSHPEIGVLGTWVEYMDENGAPRGEWRMPTRSGLIGWSLFFGNCLAHPSVMMRRDVIEQVGLYRAEFLYAQDYELWTRISAVTQFANIPEILLRRRVTQEGICSQHFQTQEENVIKTMHSMITQSLGSEVPWETVNILRQMAIGSSLTSLQQIEDVAVLVQRLYQTYLKANSLSREEAREVAQNAGDKLYALATSAGKISLWRGLVIFVQALRLNPQFTPVWDIMKGVSRRMRRT